MKVLLTGATGFLGGNLLRVLCERGYDVRYISRGGKDAIAAQGLANVEKMVGDLLDHPSLDRAVQGVDLVFHAGASISMLERDRKEMERVNVEGTRVLLEAAARHGVKRFVHVSSIDAVGVSKNGEAVGEDAAFNLAHLKNPYPDTKRAAEELVQGFDGVDRVIVNPAFMIGALDSKGSSSTMVLEVMRGKALLAPSGGNCFVDVLDACNGTIAAAERGRTGERYLLGGHNMSYLDFWSRTAAIVGKRKPLGTAPDWLALSVAALVEVWAALRKTRPLFSRQETRLSFERHYHSSEKARRELGYTISPIEPAIERAAAWFRANGYASAR